MVKCDKCGETAINRGNSQSTLWDSFSIRHTARYPHPLAVVWIGVSTVAKLAFSTVYECRACNRNWREWFE